MAFSTGSNSRRTWTDSQVEIARRQFQDLPDDDNIELDRLIRVTGNDDVLLTNDYVLTGRDIRLLVNHDYSAAISQYEKIVQPYLKHVCNYVAIERSRTRNESRTAEPKCTILLNNFIATLQRSGRQSDVVAQALELAKCRGKDMARLDYIFIPHRESTHWALLGIAPKQRMIFVIDSIFWSEQAWQPEIRPLAELVWQELAESDLLDREWLLITPSYNNMNKSWKNRIYVRQKDEESCAVFVCTNALCLAFGYPLLCYSNEPDKSKNDMPRKRRRMAMELLRNGFVPANYNYPLLDVPTEFAPLQTQTDEDRIYKGFDIPPNCREPPGLPWFQNWMTGKRRRRVGAARTVQPKKRATTSVKELQIGEKKENFEFELYEESGKPETIFPDYPVYEGKTFPKQFPKRFFEGRVLFKGKKHVRIEDKRGLFDGLSKKDLLVQCRRNKKLFMGFTSHSRKGVKEFRKWMDKTARVL